MKDDNKKEEYKEGIYTFKKNNNEVYFYSFYKVSNDGNFYYLRCKDRKQCRGLAKYIIETGEIQIIVLEIYFRD